MSDQIFIQTNLSKSLCVCVWAQRDLDLDIKLKFIYNDELVTVDRTYQLFKDFKKSVLCSCFIVLTDK